MQTERGNIFVREYAKNGEEAKKKGYEFAFHSEQLKADCFSKIVNGDINSRIFCLVEDWNMALEDMVQEIKRFIEMYCGTAIGYSIKNRLDNSDGSYESVEDIYRDLESQGYI